MSLKNISYRYNYESNTPGANPLHDFYIPALDNSIKYDRIASYYSSSSLLIAANGISGFIKNKGKMRLIMNVQIYKDDYEAIKYGSKKPFDLLENRFIRDLARVKEKIIDDRWKVLSWMIANDIVKIKIGVVPENIEHAKLGIFHDDFGNKVSMVGSSNESASAWGDQSNLFTVFNNWTPYITEILKEHIVIFERIWNGHGQKTQVYDFPEAAREGILDITGKPENFNIQKILKKLKKGEDQQKYDSLVHKSEKGTRKLYFYQRRALVSWKKKKFIGLLQMATGSGKTFTAIKGIAYLKKQIDLELKLLTIIVCPYKHLVEQWGKELAVEGESYKLIYGDNNNWRDDLKRTCQRLKLGFINSEIIITTYNTYCSKDFLNRVQKEDFEVLIIADEVHNAGSLSRRKGLQEHYKYRMGLSATPVREYDDVGTYKIEDYFDVIEEVTFIFTLEDALKNNKLCNYYYHLRSVLLNDDELQQYKSFNKDIAILVDKQDERSRERLTDLLILRAQILVNANAKYDVLNELLDSMSFDDITHTLIYCSPQQIDDVCTILAQRGIIFHRFTMNESVDERKLLIRQFEDKLYDVLVAMKCLDEGVDIPVVKKAIILASSGNSREYIQRRGRVLRRHDSKKYGEIYDFIVKRSVNVFEDEKISNVEKQIIKKQFKRILNFAGTALNSDEIKDFMLSLSEEFKVPINEEFYNA